MSVCLYRKIGRSGRCALSCVLDDAMFVSRHGDNGDNVFISDCVCVCVFGDSVLRVAYCGARRVEGARLGAQCPVRNVLRSLGSLGGPLANARFFALVVERVLFERWPRPLRAH